MKIAIIGYGRMGKLIEEVARERGHEISCVIDKEDANIFNSKNFIDSDVAIEFTVPDAAVDGIMKCFEANIPVVVGTTGWNDAILAIRNLCQQGKGTLLFSSNFSIGMNVFRAVNRYLAAIMKHIDSYSPRLEETHHIHKIDHPSGTAVTLAEELIQNYGKLNRWFEPQSEVSDDEYALPVYYKREGEVPGIHTVTWDSECDSITITHSAKGRRGFALGAVCAAEWIVGKKGFFTMNDVISLDDNRPDFS